MSRCSHVGRSGFACGNAALGETGFCAMHAVATRVSRTAARCGSVREDGAVCFRQVRHAGARCCFHRSLPATGEPMEAR